MLPGIAPPDFCTALSFLSGDSWSGIDPITVTMADTGDPPANDAVLAEMIFKLKQEDPTPLVKITSADAAQITINSAANWNFTVEPQTLNLSPGATYVWGFRVTDSTGYKLTYFQGTIDVKFGF